MYYLPRRKYTDENRNFVATMPAITVQQNPSCARAVCDRKVADVQQRHEPLRAATLVRLAEQIRLSRFAKLSSFGNEPEVRL